MKGSIFLLALALLAASLVVPAFSADQLQRYRDSMDRCAGANVRKLDDKITSAEVIGDILFEQCFMPNADLWELVSNRKSEAYKTGYLSAQRKQFTAYVLLHRTGSVY